MTPTHRPLRSLLSCGIVIAAVLACSAVFAMTQPPAAIASTETELPGVKAELLELRQQGGALRLLVRLRNEGAQEVKGQAIEYSKVTLTDAKSKKKYFPLKDASGHYLAGPVSDWNDGGRWFSFARPRVNSSIWALFEPLPAGTKVDIQIPQMFPFESVPVTEGPPTILSNETLLAVGGVAMNLVSAQRSDQQVKLHLKLSSVPQDAARGETIYYQDVFLFDPKGRRTYPLLKDTEGNYQAQPAHDKGRGGRFFPGSLTPTVLMSMTFVAPPDSVTSVDLVMPGFIPLEGIPLIGQGGATASGSEVRGKSLGLEGALKELNAKVTPTETAINLSADVLFEFDKAELKPTAEHQLMNLLTVVQSKPKAIVLVTGHTDLRGTDAYNQLLSEKRAQAVKAWLTAHGVAETGITAKGAGKSHPLRMGDTEADHQANRRVEIVVRG